MSGRKAFGFGGVKTSVQLPAVCLPIQLVQQAEGRHGLRFRCSEFGVRVGVLGFRVAAA